MLERVFASADFACRRADHRAGIFEGNWWTEIESLHLITVQTFHAFTLFLGLDAFGYHAKADSMRHFDHGLNHRVCIAEFPIEKRPIQLDDVRRQTCEIAQGRVAGSEIIQ